MAVIIDATPGGVAANSYATLDQGDDYIDTLVPSALQDDWLGAGAEDQSRALVMATRQLDTWFDWYGSITNLNQALLWPRSGVLRPGISEGQVQGGPSNPWHTPFGVELNRNEIPAILVSATVELARQLLAGDRTADSDVETQGVEGLVVGPIELTFRAGVTAKPVPDAVMSMVSALGVLRGRSGSAGAINMRRA